MSTPLTVLKQIGLGEREARIYLGLLALGEANVQELAEETRLARTSINTPMRKLLQAGIVEFYKKKRRKYYIPARPEKLLELNKQKSAFFEEHLGMFKLFGEREAGKPEIRLFEGMEGIKHVFDEILQEKRNFLAITCIEDMQKAASEYFSDFIQRRKVQNLRVRLLTNRSPESLELKRKDAEELRETRFVPREYRFTTANYIFGNKIVLLSLKRNPVVAVLIDDRAIAETQRMYFELIWRVAILG